MNNFVGATKFFLKRGFITSATSWKDSAQKCQKKIKLEAEKANFWRRIVFFITFPALAGVITYVVIEKLREPSHEKPEFIPFEYLRIRNKRFPWGDGNHTLFHNPKVNPLPDGYEDENIEEADEDLEDEEEEELEPESKM